MQIVRLKSARQVVGASAVFLLCVTLAGCTGAEETEVVTTLQTALNNLVQNRSLTEQFVRDVKASVSPSDPKYAELMDTYQEARTSYDRYLDQIEDGRKDPPTSRSMRRVGPNDVRNSTADFLAEATSVLKPDANTRRIPFQRAVVIPDNLRATLQKLPKKAREKLIDQFDAQVRWRSWGQL